MTIQLPLRKAGFDSALAVTSDHPAFHKGLSAGTEVLTADGALPIEFLSPGDRVITRSGMKVLRGVDTPAPRRFVLGFDGDEVIYADGLQVSARTGQPYLH